jgi:hypothetical protein
MLIMKLSEHKLDPSIIWKVAIMSQTCLYMFNDNKVIIIKQYVLIQSVHLGMKL